MNPLIFKRARLPHFLALRLVNLVDEGATWHGAPSPTMTAKRNSRAPRLAKRVSINQNLRLRLQMIRDEK
jgi:hypothetical protein